MIFGRLFGGAKSPVPPERLDIHQGIDLAANSGTVAGYRFCATIQLRTPLRVLRRHGTMHEGIDRLPHPVTAEQWQGIWIPVARSWRELGVDMPEPSFSMASDIGPIPSDGGDYLRFLIEVRAVAEGTAGLEEERRDAVATILAQPRWTGFVAALGGAGAVLDRLFPPFVRTVPRLPAKTAVALSVAGLATPRAIGSTSDAALRAIPGVGPGLIAALRQAAAAALDQDAQFVDQVER